MDHKYRIDDLAKYHRFQKLITAWVPLHNALTREPVNEIVLHISFSLTGRYRKEHSPHISDSEASRSPDRV